jgi:tRNA(fMet)-specific endonuclease VapC
MSLRYLLDTNIISEPIRPTPDTNVLDRLIRERARLIPIGLTPSYADGQIAAVAAVNQLILVTRNVSDYQNFDELVIENWFDP